MPSEEAPGRDFSFLLALNMNVTPEAVWALCKQSYKYEEEGKYMRMADDKDGNNLNP